MKIRPVGAELYHPDRHVTKITVAFLSFTNASKYQSVNAV